MNKKLNLLFLPGITLLLIFLLLPLVYTIIPTFLDGKDITISRYILFFKDNFHLNIFLRTVKLSAITSLITAILGLPTAYFISRTRKNLKGVLIASSVFPLLTNSVVRSFAWMTILGENGVINKMLLALGLVDKPLKMLYTEFAIVVGTVYLFLPLMILSLVGVMENIEGNLMEAAESLGANRLTAFFRIIFPLSVPGLIVGSVLVFTGALTAYTTPQLLGGNTNMVLATLIYQKAMTLGDWTGAAVVANIMIITTLSVMFIINRLASKISGSEV